MVATTWVVPSAVFFTSIIGWQYFVGYRSVPVGKCFVQYMDSAVFNCLLQLGYFWATLVIMCVLYGGIYCVALRLHREPAARRRIVAAVAAQTSSHQQVPAAADSASSVALRPPVVMATVSAAGRDHTHHQSRTCSPDLSLSEHDVVATRRHDDANDVTLLIPVPVELTQADTSSSRCVTFTVADVDIRFADVVEDDDVIGRRLISTSGNDAILHPHQQQQQSDHVDGGLRHYRTWKSADDL